MEVRTVVDRVGVLVRQAITEAMALWVLTHVCLNVFLMKFSFYWILTEMGMREGCTIKCIGNYLVEDLFFREKDFWSIARFLFIIYLFKDIMLFLQLENELHTVSSRLSMVTDDKNKLEDKFSSIEAAHMLAQDQANQLQVCKRFLLHMFWLARW